MFIICLLVSNTCTHIGSIVDVEITGDKPVSFFLKQVVKQNDLNVLHPNILPLLLTAWQPNSSFPSHPINDLARRVGELYLNSEENRAATQLDPAAVLQDYFPEPPPSKHIHIVIQLPQERSLEAEPDVPLGAGSFDELTKRLPESPFVQQAPSTVARPSEFRKYQDKVDVRVLNDRPNKDVKAPPIALMYGPFGNFMDHIRDPPEKEPGINMRNFQFAVDDFASVMCKHFGDEPERQRTVLPVLNHIFECYEPFRLPLIAPGKISGEITSDGHANGPAGVMETVVEIKNEFGSGQTDPEIQFISYFLQMCNSQFRSGPHKESFQKYLCPTLGITIIGIKTRLSYHLPVLMLFFPGSYIGFGALILLDRARYVALTPLLPTRSPSGDDTHRPSLFQAFRAACFLRANIHKDTQRIINKISDLPPICDRYLPRVHEIQPWPPTGVEQLKFRIRDVAYQDAELRFWNHSRFIYHAETGTQHKEVLVKFTRRYCHELHFFVPRETMRRSYLATGLCQGGGRWLLWNTSSTIMTAQTLRPSIG